MSHVIKFNWCSVIFLLKDERIWERKDEELFLAKFAALNLTLHRGCWRFVQGYVWRYYLLVDFLSESQILKDLNQLVLLVVIDQVHFYRLQLGIVYLPLRLVCKEKCVFFDNIFLLRVIVLFIINTPNLRTIHEDREV